MTSPRRSAIATALTTSGAGTGPPALTPLWPTRRVMSATWFVRCWHWEAAAASATAGTGAGTPFHAGTLLDPRLSRSVVAPARTTSAATRQGRYFWSLWALRYT
jgi:hypothetical protein